MDDPIVIVSARDEADRLPATLAALRAVFPDARVLVADDGSRDATARLARAAGAEVVPQPSRIGRGGANGAVARVVLERTTAPDPPIVVLCDGDLGESARHLPQLVAAVQRGEADLAIATFARKVGGGFGVAVGFPRAALPPRTRLELEAPISGQRAMRGEVLAAVAPFAPRFGMETGMTIDAHRAGFSVKEVPLDLEHRATGRTLRGFLHRGRQLADIGAAAFDRMAR